jgi:HK97 family phage portal protein
MYGVSVTTGYGPSAYRIEDRVTQPADQVGDGHSAALAYAYEYLGWGDAYREDRITAETALTYSAFWGCVRVILQAISPLGWGVFEKRPDDPRTKLPVEDDVAWLLGMQASPEMSALDWRQVMLLHALIRGNAYAEIERDGFGRPRWLWWLATERVTPTRLDSGRFAYEVDNGVSSPKVVIPPENMFHLKGMGPDGLVGYSVVEMARHTIKLGKQEERFGSSYFGKGPMPGGILKIPGSVSPEAKSQARRSFEETYGGTANAGKVVVLTGGMEFTPLSLPNDDAEFLDSRLFQIEEVCRWFGVPPHKVADLAHATYCLPAGSLVFTPGGPVPIESVAAGDLVWSMDGSKRMVTSRVEASGRSGRDEVLTVRTRNRVLRCNARHRVLVRRQTLSPSAGGRGSHVVVGGVKCRRAWSEAWVAAGELREGDALVSLAGLPDPGGSEAPTREATVGFMEVLGMLTGDGFFARNARSGRGTTFGISHGEDDAYLPHYVQTVEREFRQYDGPYGRKNGGTCELTAVRRDKNTTVFYSGLAYDELEACGVVGTSKTKRVPGWVFGLREELRLAFLRGFLDADGTVTKNGQVRFVSVNRMLIEQVRHLCISCGVRVANLYSDRIKSKFEGYPEYEHVLYSFICTDAKENRRIGSHTPWYVDRIEQRLASRRVRDRDTIRPYEIRERQAADGLLASQIVSIVRSETPEDVFDLTVSGTHTFVADGLVVHNSNIEEQEIAFVRDCLLPWCRRLEMEADIKLFGRTNRGRRFTRLNLDALLRGNSQTQTTTVMQKVTGGVLTINEGREYFDLNPIDGGDTPLVQGAMVPLERVLEEPEPPPPPAPPAPPPDEEEEDDPNADSADADNAKGEGKAAENTAEVRRVFGALLEDAFMRLLRVDADKAKRAANKGKLAEHLEEYYDDEAAGRVAVVLGPLFEGLYLVTGGTPVLPVNATAAIAAVMHVEWCREWFAARLDGWESRPAEAAREVLEGLS